MVTLSRDDIRRLVPEVERIPGTLPEVRHLMARLVEALEASDDAVVSIAVQDSDPWMTTAEVAALFRVSERTVRQWCEQGYLHARRAPGPRGMWRIPKDQFPADGAAVKRLLNTVGDINRRFTDPPPDDYER